MLEHNLLSTTALQALRPGSIAMLSFADHARDRYDNTSAFQINHTLFKLECRAPTIVNITLALNSQGYVHDARAATPLVFRLRTSWNTKTGWAAVDPLRLRDTDTEHS